MNDLSLQINALHAQIRARAIVITSIANLARTIYKPGVLVRYNDRSVEPVKTDIGKVLDVERNGSDVLIHVTPTRGRKVRAVQVEDIIGIMLEGDHANP